MRPLAAMGVQVRAELEQVVLVQILFSFFGAGPGEAGGAAGAPEAGDAAGDDMLEGGSGDDVLGGGCLPLTCNVVCNLESAFDLAATTAFCGFCGGFATTRIASICQRSKPPTKT